jgi:hypothetical protein
VDLIVQNIEASFFNLLSRLRNAFSDRDAMAMQYLSPLYRTYLPWSAASMGPASIVIVLNEILVNHRRSIVECGSGVSTYFIAKILQGSGGRLLTIDDNDRWLLTVKSILRQENLDHCVTFLHAPLAPCDLAPGEPQWYDTKILDSAMHEISKIDLLLVDGPPACTPGTEYSRYPAGPYFKSNFADDFTILLHDIDRAPERKLMTLWGKCLGVRFEVRLSDDRIAIGRTAAAFAI